MDTKHITAVHYVHANDPIGRLILQTMGNLWSGDEPHGEYLRGQVETVCDMVRLTAPWEGEVDFEDQKERATVLIASASQGTLNYALQVLYSAHHDWCPTCEKVTEYDGDECLGCGRLWGHDS